MRRFTNKIVVIMRTFRSAIAMSALPPKADIGTQPRNVRFVPKADIRRDSEIIGRSPHPAELAASPRRPRWGVSSRALLRPPVCDVRQGFHASRRTRAPQALLALVRAKAMLSAWSAHRKVLAAIAPP